MVMDITLSYSSSETREVAERSDKYANFVEKSLLFKTSPARFASTFGLDKTLDWEEEREEDVDSSSSLLKSHSS